MSTRRKTAKRKSTRKETRTKKTKAKPRGKPAKKPRNLSSIGKKKKKIFPSVKVNTSSIEQHKRQEDETQEEIEEKVFESSIERDMMISSSTRSRTMLPKVRISKVKISLLNQDKFKDSAIRVHMPYTQGGNKKGTLHDPRFGSDEFNVKCGSCNKPSTECRGHEGYIEMPVYVYNKSLIPYIVMVLNSICEGCNCLLVSKMQLEREGILAFPSSERLRRISKMSENIKKCMNTGNVSFETESGQIIQVPHPQCVSNPEYASTASRAKGQIVIKAPISKGSKTKKEVVRPIEEIYKKLDAIDDDTARILGFGSDSKTGPIRSHPRDMIIRYFPVSAKCFRREHKGVDNKWSDDMSPEYNRIVSASDNLRSMKMRSSGLRFSRSQQKKGKKVMTKDDYAAEISKAIDTIIDNGPETSGKSTGKKKKSIKTLYAGKEGILRSSILGKRVNYTARSVLSPGVNLEFGEIGIPREMARVLTIRVKVTHANINRVKTLWNEGKITHRIPGSGKMFGTRINIEKEKVKSRPNRRKTWIIEIGDIVTRHMMDGDYIIFNRQPTLHQGSIMGYKVKLHDGYTVKVHLGSTPPHNADFDGDEGTLHFVQTIAAQAEVMTIMSASYNIMSGQNNRPMVGVVFDALASAYLMTADNVKLSQSQMSSVIMSIFNLFDFFPEKWDLWDRLEYTEDKSKYDGPVKFTHYLKGPANPKGIGCKAGYLCEHKDENGVIKYPVVTRGRLSKHGIEPNSGKGVFSILLEKDLFYERGGVLIEDGVLIKGRISKKDVGSSNGSLIHVLRIHYGRDEAARFITYAYFMLNTYMESIGLSVSANDCMAPEGILRQRMEKLREDEMYKAKLEASKFGPPKDNPILEEERRRGVSRALNVASSIGEKATKEMLSMVGANVDKDLNTLFEESDQYDARISVKGKYVEGKVKASYLEGKDKMVGRFVKEEVVMKREKGVIDQKKKSLEKLQKRLEFLSDKIQDIKSAQSNLAQAKNTTDLIFILLNCSANECGSGFDINDFEDRAVDVDPAPEILTEEYKIGGYAKSILSEISKYNSYYRILSKTKGKVNGSNVSVIQAINLLSSNLFEEKEVKSSIRRSKKPIKRKIKLIDIIATKYKNVVIFSKRRSILEDEIANMELQARQSSDAELSEYISSKISEKKDSLAKTISAIENDMKSIRQMRKRIIDRSREMLEDGSYIQIADIEDATVEAANGIILNIHTKISEIGNKISATRRYIDTTDVRLNPYKQEDNMLIILNRKSKNKDPEQYMIIDGTKIQIDDVLFGVYSIEPIEATGYCKYVDENGDTKDVENMSRGNNLVLMSKAGSKGGVGHIAQISMFIGQQYIGGQILRRSLSSDTRCSVYTRQRQDGQKFVDPEDTGFCVSSFMDGLNPKEYFSHLTASREGLTNTAIRTQVTGEYQRILSKALEGFIIGDDGFVRNSSNKVIQTVYGHDGLNPAELINIDIGGQRLPFFMDVGMVFKSLNAKVREND